MENTVFLLLGTNIGDRQLNLQTAQRLLKSHAQHIQNMSSIYRTAAWGIEDQPDFFNQVLEITTTLNPSDLLRLILLIEQDMGRVREMKWGPRIIDIDILFYEDRIIEMKNLKIPHPELHLRRFTLEPLNELIPDFKHPILHKTITQLLNECPDQGVVSIEATSASE